MRSLGRCFLRRRWPAQPAGATGLPARQPARTLNPKPYTLNLKPLNPKPATSLASPLHMASSPPLQHEDLKDVGPKPGSWHMRRVAHVQGAQAGGTMVRETPLHWSSLPQTGAAMLRRSKITSAWARSVGKPSQGCVAPGSAHTQAHQHTPSFVVCLGALGV